MDEVKGADGNVTYKGYVDANAKLYFDYKSDTDPKSFKEITKASEVKTIIKAVNKKVDDAAGEVNKLIEKTTVRVQNKQHPKATNGACYLLGYTVNFNLGEKTFADTKSVVAEFYKDKNVIGTLELKDPNSDKVKTAKSADGTLDVFGDYDSDSWKQEWNGKVTDIPTKVVVKVDFAKEGLATKEIEIKGLESFDTVPFLVEAVNRAETAEEMSRALINLEAKMDNSKAFTNLSKAAKLEVAELVLAARAEEKGIDGIPNTAGKFFENGTLTYKGVFDNVKIDAYEAYINGVNEVVTKATDENLATIAKMRTALDNETYFPEFAKLSAADKTLKAELVLNNIPKDKDGKVVGYKTIAEIKAAAGL